MTKKVLIISPSPRRGGNTNPLCDEFRKYLYLSVILLVMMTACNNQKTEIMEEEKEPVLGLGTHPGDVWDTMTVWESSVNRSANPLIKYGDG